MLPEPYNHMAIEAAENCPEGNNIDNESYSMAYALSGSIVWQYSEMGHEFWEAVCEDAKYHEQKQINAETN